MSAAKNVHEISESVAVRFVLDQAITWSEMLDECRHDWLTKLPGTLAET